MTFRLAAMVATVILASPTWAATSGGKAIKAAQAIAPEKSVENDGDLPLSRDVLFDTAPPDSGKGGQVPAAEDQPLPASKDDLFAPEPVQDNRNKADGKVEDALPSSKESLFSEDATSKEDSTRPPNPVGARAGTPRVQGYSQAESAYTYASPVHWSKVLGRLELGTQGDLGQGVRWKLSGRVDYNAVYDLNDFYQPAVRDDQRTDFQLRETYLDFSTGGLDWRLGRQQIVWGEMVGIFVADVVTAKDLREFILPDFETLRIPQWAVRSEYFHEDFHAEVVWIPLPSYDLVGKPTDFTLSGSGADFYPYPPAQTPVILNEVKPSNSLDHGNFGVRVNQLMHGWDLSGFIYTSMNSSATLYRSPVVSNIFTYTPRHDRIWQAGGTLGKDLGDVVLKAEAVYSEGRRFNLIGDPTDADGVVKQNTLDWAVGLDFNLSSDTRVNTQLFQRYFFDHNPDIVPDKTENGCSLLISHNFPRNWKVETLLIHSLNRSDWMLRPKASWGFQPNWKLTFGLDVFGGPPTGIFGQYDDQDRAYAQVRYDF
jgi:hypothetical protein